MSEPQVVGGFTSIHGVEQYRISAWDRMPPFLVNLASDTDLWGFISSRGGLTAGRVDPDGSLFPYETVDRLHDGHHHTGPVTIFRVLQDDGSEIVWRPFYEAAANGAIERNLYKNITGNQLTFEEIRTDLGLAFRYRWSGCDEFGFVRTAELENRGPHRASVKILDGLRNVLPFGAPLALYQQSSTLVDAYKQTDLDAEAGLATFSLTSRIIDRAEAAESLRANVVWSCGLEDPDITLSIDAIERHRLAQESPAVLRLNGGRGNFLLRSAVALEGGARKNWHVVADAGRSHMEITALRARLLAAGDLGQDIEEALRRAEENLSANVASADGRQLTGEAAVDAHHFANVLFNNMRGGVFADGYRLPTVDFLDFLETRNRSAAARQRAFVASWPEEIAWPDVIRYAENTNDADFRRLAYEYLPIHFGRRHGDPSRPWNRFTVRVRTSEGRRALRYEGNWRDIFQNWEALCFSFPGFLPGVLAKFLNATTVDGFNPYRVTRDGVDWEVVDADDPWSYIGYWGDHQIVYLLKFLESMSRFSPGRLEEMLGSAWFSYANVPYRLRPYKEIIRNPHDTIAFDTERAELIAEREANLGTDGRLVHDRNGAVLHVSLIEKLLVPALSKLSNLVPDAGIWMNTQRPEWNDANNALVGNGVSMVTLGYLRRYLAFVGQLTKDAPSESWAISAEVARWLTAVRKSLAAHDAVPTASTNRDGERRRTLDALGEAFSEYRATIYEKGLSGDLETIRAEDITVICDEAVVVLDRTLCNNQRSDGLYHSYNLLEIPSDQDKARLHRLDEMLEGQVSALSSGVVSPSEAVDLLDSLFDSRLYRADQRSFLLYPEKELPEFLDRNVLTEERVQDVPLLREMLAAGEASVLARDVSGICRFHGDFANAGDVQAALDRLAKSERWAEAIETGRPAVLELFEEVFRHRSFTGRSGRMYGYEGLGCIYWHMVAKLLLAVQEILLRAIDDGESGDTIQALKSQYFKIRGGLGFEKTPVEFGAFPTDPYSHTPPGSGAKQPGMTGQVKEEILTRFGELGVRVARGCVRFQPTLLRRREFRTEAGSLRTFSAGGRQESLAVPPGSLAFTFCQVPVLYEITNGEAWIRVMGLSGEATQSPGDSLDPDTSASIFGRDGTVVRVEVGIPEARIG